LTFACAVAAAVILRAFTFTTAGLDWDESLYVVMAQQWLLGGLPYVVVWDQHPAGLPALFAVAQTVSGDGVVAARLVALLAVSGTAALLYGTVVRQTGERMAGMLAAALYLLYMTRPDGLVANTEVVNNLFVTAAAALLMRETRPARAMRAGVMFLAALLLGIGLQIKYVVLPEAVTFCCLALVLAWQDGVGLSRLLWLAGLGVLGGILPTAAMTMYFWSAGALQPYLDANLLANAAYLNLPLRSGTMLLRLRYGLLPIVALLPWPVVLAVLIRRLPNPALRHVMLWLAIWIVAAAIDIVLPFKFWKHYFNALLPPMVMATGLACVLIARQMPRRRPATAAAMAAVVAIPAVLLMLKHLPDSRSIDRPNVPREVADAIRKGGSDGHDVYVFNYDPLVYSYANVVPPTRFVLGIELADFEGSSGAQPLQEVDSVLERSPEWIVVANPSPYAFSPAVLQQLQTTLRAYRLYGEWREADYIQPPIEVRLYRRSR
jgi:4-amino-4-deoxy-L-arabinose transferase-like glycosyltransferase